MGGTIRIEGDNLVFEINGIDEILSFKRTISVPLEHVTSVSTEKVPWDYSKQMRVGGTGIPWIVKDGRYLSDDGMMFFEMHNPDKCITVSLDHETYRSIVFEVDDKMAAALTIQAALSSRRDSNTADARG
ncbi:MAG: hypothetical protein ABSG45_09770 [Nitrososphaerales archaeon]